MGLLSSASLPNINVHLKHFPYIKRFGSRSISTSVGPGLGQYCLLRLLVDDTNIYKEGNSLSGSIKTLAPKL